MTRSENATLYFADTFNCSQSILASFGQEFGLTEEQCLKLGTAFGGGMARSQMTCGAVTGALMVLSLKFVPIHPEKLIQGKTKRIFYRIFMIRFMQYRSQKRSILFEAE